MKLNWFSNNHKIACKSPVEIERQFRSYVTRRDNLYAKAKTHKHPLGLYDEMYKLDIKIKLLENILNLDK